ncbi:MAG: alpha/beta hydrolase [Chthoniobacterales bacterium]|nr:alpha/beta hydrolase [Chthoniobacterales bacterium]
MKGWAAALSLGGLLLGATFASAQIAPSSHFAKLNGIRVHYTNYATGEKALLLVHGWSSDETVWKQQAPELAKSIRVITVDLPGHGQSDKPEREYTMDFYAQALDAVLRDARVKKATVVGHSNGTIVIRQFYRLYPPEVNGMVTVDGSMRPLGEPEEMKKFIEPLRVSEFQYAKSAGKFIDHFIAPIKDPAERSATREMMLRTPQRVALSEFEATSDPTLSRTDKIEVPLLVILAKSPFWEGYEDYVRKLAPQAEFKNFEDVSHFLMLDKPAEFNETLLAFLKKNDLLKN